MVHVEQRSLRTLEQHDLALIERVVDVAAGVDDVRADGLGVLHERLDDVVDLDRATVVDLHQKLVLLLERGLDLLAQDRLVEQVLDADAEPVDLVGVAGPDAAAGGADAALAEASLLTLIKRNVAAVAVKNVHHPHLSEAVRAASTSAGERA